MGGIRELHVDLCPLSSRRQTTSRSSGAPRPHVDAPEEVAVRTQRVSRRVSRGMAHESRTRAVVVTLRVAHARDLALRWAGMTTPCERGGQPVHGGRRRYPCSLRDCLRWLALTLAAWFVLAVVVEAREAPKESPTPQLRPLPHTTPAAPSSFRRMTSASQGPSRRPAKRSSRSASLVQNERSPRGAASRT